MAFNDSSIKIKFTKVPCRNLTDTIFYSTVDISHLSLCGGLLCCCHLDLWCWRHRRCGQLLLFLSLLDLLLNMLLLLRWLWGLVSGDAAAHGRLRARLVVQHLVTLDEGG